ncbi:MAG: filamentous hemagglutinin N-terminal domain-containing protein, partial [Pseudomonadota bacterium]|nr:filamentous hemagglutinin N-terminal domain-containing protein [Pseudomonadota bacterium]
MAKSRVTHFRSSMRAAFCFGAALLCFASGGMANPHGGVVAHGTATIDGSLPGVLTVTNAPNTVINWQGFSIDPGELTQFLQDNARSAVLNRVVSQDPSAILGSLISNGRVFLINPNGILFGEGAVVDTAGFVAATLGMTDEDFLAGEYRFSGPEDAGGIENRGYIVAAPGGSVVLIAPDIENHGVIRALEGNVTLAAGAAVTLTSLDDPSIEFEVQAPDHEVLNLGQILTPGGAASLFAGTIRQQGVVAADTIGLDDTGRVVLSASHHIDLAAGSRVSAVGIGAQAGGTVQIAVAEGGQAMAGAGVLNQHGNIRADGRDGGSVTITAGKVLDTGTISADGSRHGGGVTLVAEERYIGTFTAELSARGGTGQGGTVRLESDHLFASTRVGASGKTGGHIEVLGDHIKLAGATLDASGISGGGAIRVGGELRGAETLRQARTATVYPGTVLDASASAKGDGGTVAVWSNESTSFSGTARARGGDESGDGGFVEISGKASWTYSGEVDVTAPHGAAGTVLWDPAFLTITAGGIGGVLELLDPNPGAGNFFGNNTRILGNGNIVIQDPNDDFVAADAGAVYTFDPATGVLLGVVQGGKAGELLGGSINTLFGDDFLILSASADNGGLVNAGAAIRVDDATGMEIGRIVGNAAGDMLGSQGVQLDFTNQTYLLRIPDADVGGNIDAGEVVLADGLTGGEIARIQGDAANDRLGDQSVQTGVGPGFDDLLITITSADVGGFADAGQVRLIDGASGAEIGRADGASTSEFFGSFGFTTLNNRNLVFQSSNADTGGFTNNGRVVLLNTTTGATGVVEGNSDNEFLGNISTLYGNEYAIFSRFADSGALVDAGAVIFVDPDTGLEINRVTGNAAGDEFGSSAPNIDSVNNTYFVQNRFADIGGLVDAGEIVIIDAATGLVINRIQGEAANDRLGDVGIRRNVGPAGKDWLIHVQNADAGGFTDSGQFRLVDGATGVEIGRVNGVSDFENLGEFANPSLELANRNWVLGSRKADTGGFTDNGRVITLNTATGTFGVVEGNSDNEQMGSLGDVNQLFGNEFLIVSDLADAGPNVDAGAAIFVDPVTGLEISRITGNAANDRLGSFGVQLDFTNQTYLLRVPDADIGGNMDAGEVVLADGSTGAPITRIQGDAANDRLGDQSVQTGVGPAFDDLLITVSNADTGGFTDSGQVRLIDGATGAEIGRADGVSNSEFFGAFGFTTLSNRNLVFGSPDADSGGFTDNGRAVFLNTGTGASAGIAGNSDFERLGDFGQINTLFGNEFLIVSELADAGPNADTGAAIFVDPVTGLEISRITGNAANDMLGAQGVQLDFTNQTYLLRVPDADVAGKVDAGEVVLADGLTGAQIARIQGDAANDRLGDQFIQTGMGPAFDDLLITISNADTGGFTDSGQVRLIDGATGAEIGRADGVSNNEQFGSFGFTTLSNRNLVFGSPNADSG